ncbi:MAG: hypothetical protein WAU15_11075 [Nitrosomonas sp.]
MTNIKQTLSAISVLGALLTFSMSASANSSVVYADPVPGSTEPGVCNGGISYEWTVKMSDRHTAGFVNHVGAKSFNEPPPAYEPPDTGWTHTANWVAFELDTDAMVEIEVMRQEGVPYASKDSAGLPIMETARNKLVPAFAIYSGWDETSCEEHRFNNSGDTDWTTVKYMTNALNKGGWATVKRKIKLKAGQYTIAIGGSPKVLDTYPDAKTCDPKADAVCYGYTGRHGYRVNMKTRPIKSAARSSEDSTSSTSGKGAANSSEDSSSSTNGKDAASSSEDSTSSASN